MDMLTPNPHGIASRQRATSVILMASFLSFGATTHAAVFRCVDANGANTYSDRPCASADADRSTKPDGGVTAAPAAADSPKIKKAARILDLLRIAAPEPESLVLERTVDDAAPDLVRALDPDNVAWTPANAKWHSVLEFVKSDLRRDVQTSLRESSAEISHVTAQAFAARADDGDLDATLKFLATGDGSRYIALESEIGRIIYEALDSLLAQESVPEQPPSDATLHRRQALLALALDYRIVTDGGGPPPSGLQPGSTAVVEYSARHDGLALDALASEYEPYLPAFQSFSDSPTTKRMFRALEPAVRTYTALSGTATTEFAEMELGKYFMRWRAVYGPSMKGTVRTTVMIRGRMVAITRTSQVTIGAAGSPEAMAIACEQREDRQYQNTHRSYPDTNGQTAALKTIQNRCRAEQRLPPL